ncbi:FAD binding domain-containing protein [Sarocladium implicatum]|nr:FAD binding domain-containing protein [Sarocladium implicatum]
MPALRVLISGGGIAGPTLAHALLRLGHSVTILERSPSLRATGQQVDIREQAITAATRLGLISSLRDIIVHENGLQFVDGEGKQLALFQGDGKDRLSPSAEFELMRGDIARMLWEKTRETAEWRFGAMVEGWQEDGDGVKVKMSDGKEESYDLLVAADGQNSRIRKMMLDRAGFQDHTKSLGVLGGYFSVPRTASDPNMASVYQAVGGYVYSTRWHSETTGQGYLLTMSKEKEFRRVMAEGTTQEKKDVLAKMFSDRGWQSNRLVEAMRETDDFYAAECIQVMSDKWSSGRVVLLGDAGYCPSPLTGMGTSLAFIGSYVLAGEIGRADQSQTKGLSSALENYEAKLRGFVEQVHKLPPGVPRAAYPETKFGVWLSRSIIGIASRLQADKIASKLLPTSRNPWELPRYPDLDVEET